MKHFDILRFLRLSVVLCLVIFSLSYCTTMSEDVVEVQCTGGIRTAQHISALTKRQVFGDSTRSETVQGNDNDNLVYVVNFAENSGYAILNANSNYQDTVLMVGDFGNYDPSDLNNRIGLFDPDFAPTPDSLKLMYADLYCEEDDEFYIGNVGGADGGDRTGNNFTDDFIRNYYMGDDDSDPGIGVNDYGFVISEFFYPKLNTQWGQGWPFNNFFHLDPDTYTHRDAGCTTIAAAQILAKLKNVPPTQIMADVTSTWGDMEKIVNRDSLASDQTVEDLGKIILAMADGIGVKYNYLGSGGTFATPSMVKRYLKRLGCDVTKYNSFSENVQRHIYNSLKSSKPVFIGALDSNVFDGGHAWVIDGYGTKPYPARSFLHCNFGWNGLDNGWYLSSLFSNESDERMLDDENNQGVEFHYSWWFRVLIID